MDKSTQDFTLWLEFEHVDYSAEWASETDTFVTGGNWDRENEFCNVCVTLADGRYYALNVWTYAFLGTAVQQESAAGRNLAGTYQIPPDLFVRELTRECIENTIADLLNQGDLEKLLNPSIVACLLDENN